MKSIVIIFAFFLSLCVTNLGQENLITLDSLFTMAKSNSLELKTLEKEIEVKQQDIVIAKSQLYPYINTSFKLGYNDYSTQGRDPVASVTFANEAVSVYPIQPLRYSGNLDLTLTQTLYAGKRILSTIHMQKNKLKQEFLHKKQKESDLFFKIQLSYWTLLDLELQKNWLTSYLNYLKKVHTMMLQKKDSGLATQQTCDEAEINALNTEEELANLESDIAVQKQKLETHIQAELPDHFTLSQMPRSKDALQAIMKSFANNSDSQSPALQSLKTDGDISLNAISINQSRFLPQLTLQGGVNYFKTDTDNPVNTFKKLNYGNGYVILQLNYPLFTGFSNKAELQKSRIAYQLWQDKFHIEKKNAQIQETETLQALEKAVLDVARHERLLRLSRKHYQQALTLTQQGDESQLELERLHYSALKSDLLTQKSLIKIEIELAKLCAFYGDPEPCLKI